MFRVPGNHEIRIPINYPVVGMSSHHPFLSLGQVEDLKTRGRRQQSLFRATTLLCAEAGVQKCTGRDVGCTMHLMNVTVTSICYSWVDTPWKINMETRWFKDVTFLSLSWRSPFQPLSHPKKRSPAELPDFFFVGKNGLLELDQHFRLQERNEDLLLNWQDWTGPSPLRVKSGVLGTQQKVETQKMSEISQFMVLQFFN